MSHTTITPTKSVDLLNAFRRLDVSFNSAGDGFMNERSNWTSSKDVTQVKVIGSVGRDYELKGRFYLATKHRLLTLLTVYVSQANVPI